MKRKFLVFLGGLSIATAASACGDPSEQWYADVSDVVFDGLVRCQPEKRVCQIRVTRVLKNPQNLLLMEQPIEVDYQNWYADYYAANPDGDIIITCGVPVFEPEKRRFRARFYANLDAKSHELIVRTARMQGKAAAVDE